MTTPPQYELVPSGLNPSNKEEEYWVVGWKNGNRTALCPCCDRLMKTRKAARLVAEALIKKDLVPPPG